MHELMKIPDLVTHYNDFTKAYPTSSVYDFFEMHYLVHHEDNGDEKEDMKLPFKTFDFSPLSMSLQTPPKVFNLSFDFQIYSEKINNFQYSEGFSTEALRSVFRPPILG